MKEQDKTPEEQLNGVEICNLPDKELKVINIKILKELKGRMYEDSDKFNKECRKYKESKELKNKVTD